MTNHLDNFRDDVRAWRYEDGNNLPGVYILQHVNTGKFYVGSTQSLYMRRAFHFSKLKNGTHINKPLQKLYNEDPEFKFIVIITRTKEEALLKEQEIVDLYHGDEKLLNVAKDVFVSARGTTRSEETRQKQKDTILATRIRNGWEPKKKKVFVPMAVEIEGVFYPSVNAAAETLGVTVNTIQSRVRSNSSTFQRWIFSKLG